MEYSTRRPWFQACNTALTIDGGGGPPSPNVQVPFLIYLSLKLIFTYCFSLSLFFHLAFLLLSLSVYSTFLVLLALLLSYGCSLLPCLFHIFFAWLPWNFLTPVLPEYKLTAASCFVFCHGRGPHIVVEMFG